MAICSVLLRVYVYPYFSGKRAIADKTLSHTLCIRVVSVQENDAVSAIQPRSAELSYYFYVFGDSSVYVCTLHSILNVYFLNKTVIIIKKWRTKSIDFKTISTSNSVHMYYFLHTFFFHSLNFQTILYLQRILNIKI